MHSFSFNFDFFKTRNSWNRKKTLSQDVPDFSDFFHLILWVKIELKCNTNTPIKKKFPHQLKHNASVWKSWSWIFISSVSNKKDMTEKFCENCLHRIMAFSGKVFPFSSLPVRKRKCMLGRNSTLKEHQSEWTNLSTGNLLAMLVHITNIHIKKANKMIH